MRKRFTRAEKKEINAHRKLTNQAGTGLFVFENNSNGELTLPKKTASGQMRVGPRGKFQGDSYFMSYVGHPHNMLRLIETIIPQGEPMSEKLILDQPDTVTNQGKVEHVVTSENPVILKPINDGTNFAPQPEILITEAPLDGVEIIRG